MDRREGGIAYRDSAIAGKNQRCIEFHREKLERIFRHCVAEVGWQSRPLMAIAAWFSKSF